MIKRSEYNILTKRIKEPRKFIQVLMGPRQVGKSTLVKQVIQAYDGLSVVFSADAVPASQPFWISECWDIARAKMKAQNASECVLVIDEIQKIRNWSETVKKEWDADTLNDINLKVILLGSSRVLLLKGMSESLAGRFEEIRLGHWTFSEMREAFGVSLEEYIYFGAYPGAAQIINDSDRWREYIRSAMVESTINKDILYDNNITKPALLKQTMELGASYSSEIVALKKIVGTLDDAGNTTTLAGYLNLLDKSGLLAGLQKFAMDSSRRRMSPPKFQVYNNSLYTIYHTETLEQVLADKTKWGRYFESAVGAYLINMAYKHNFELFYWRKDDFEVDYVMRKNGKVAAFEVKSGNEKNTRGLELFRGKFAPTTALIVGDGGLPVEEFFGISPLEFL